MTQRFYCISNVFWPGWAIIKVFNTKQLVEVLKFTKIMKYEMIYTSVSDKIVELVIKSNVCCVLIKY